METLFKQQDLRGTPLSISATSVPGNSKPGLELLRFATVAPIPSFHHRTPISSSIFGFRVRDFSSLKRPVAHKSLIKMSGINFSWNPQGDDLGAEHGFSDWIRSRSEVKSRCVFFIRHNLSYTWLGYKCKLSFIKMVMPEYAEKTMKKHAWLGSDGDPISQMEGR